MASAPLRRSMFEELLERCAQLQAQVDSLRDESRVQLKRIAELQAQLDRQPQAFRESFALHGVEHFHPRR